MTRADGHPTRASAVPGRNSVWACLKSSTSGKSLPKTLTQSVEHASMSASGRLADRLGADKQNAKQQMAGQVRGRNPPEHGVHLARSSPISRRADARFVASDACPAPAIDHHARMALSGAATDRGDRNEHRRCGDRSNPATVDFLRAQFEPNLCAPPREEARTEWLLPNGSRE